MQPVSSIILLSKNEETYRRQILYSTHELDTEEETLIVTSAFPDFKTKHPDYLYFNCKSHFYVSVIFDGRKEWEHNCLALVAICQVPFVHQIHQILFQLKDIYTAQTSMINTKLIDSFVPLVNSSYQQKFTQSTIAFSLIERLDYHLLTLIKLFLLEYRVLIIASKEQTAIASETILFLLSLIPGSFFPKPQNDEFDKLQLPLAINSYNRPVFMHLTMDNFYQMGKGGVIACVSSPLVLNKSTDYDVVVDLSTSKFVYQKKSIEKTIDITQTDKVFIYNMKESIAKYNKGCAKGNEGSRGWIFTQCTNYILAFLHGLARNKSMFGGEKFKTTGELQEVCVDFGKNFVTTFMKTSIFRDWKLRMEQSNCKTKSYERVHPTFDGDIGTNTSNFVKSYFGSEILVDTNILFQSVSGSISEWKRKRNMKKESIQMNETNEMKESDEMNQINESNQVNQMNTQNDMKENEEEYHQNEMKDEEQMKLMNSKFVTDDDNIIVEPNQIEDDENKPINNNQIPQQQNEMNFIENETENNENNDTSDNIEIPTVEDKENDNQNQPIDYFFF